MKKLGLVSTVVFLFAILTAIPGLAGEYVLFYHNDALGSPVVLGAPEALWRAVATGTTAGAFEAAWSFHWREWRERRRQGRLR